MIVANSKMGRGLFARRRRQHDLTGKKLVRARQDVETVLLGDNWELVALPGNDPRPEEQRQPQGSGPELLTPSATLARSSLQANHDPEKACLPPTPPPTPPNPRSNGAESDTTCSGVRHRSRKTWWSARGFSFPPASTLPTRSGGNGPNQDAHEPSYLTDSEGDYDDDCTDAVDHPPPAADDILARHDDRSHCSRDGALDDDDDDADATRTKSSMPQRTGRDGVRTELCRQLGLAKVEPAKLLAPRLEPKGQQRRATPHPRRRQLSPIQSTNNIEIAVEALTPGPADTTPHESPVQPAPAPRPGPDSPPTPPTSPIFDPVVTAAGLVGARAAEVVAVHNQLRAAHGAPPLEWDEDCAEQAAAAAADNASSGVMHHCHFGAETAAPMGQNIYYFERPGDLAPGDQIEALAIAAWYSEIEYYDFADARHQPGTGHATQLLWRGTRKVGVALSPDGRYVVANYAPHGNVRGKYHDNLAPPAEGHEWLRSTLPLASEGASMPPLVQQVRCEPRASDANPAESAQRGQTRTRTRTRATIAGRSHSSSVAQRRQNRGRERIRLEVM